MLELDRVNAVWEVQVPRGHEVPGHASAGHHPHTQEGSALVYILILKSPSRPAPGCLTLNDVIRMDDQIRIGLGLLLVCLLLVHQRQQHVVLNKFVLGSASAMHQLT